MVVVKVEQCEVLLEARLLDMVLRGTDDSTAQHITPTVLSGGPVPIGAGGAVPVDGGGAVPVGGGGAVLVGGGGAVLVGGGEHVTVTLILTSLHCTQPVCTYIHTYCMLCLCIHHTCTYIRTYVRRLTHALDVCSSPVCAHYLVGLGQELVVSACSRAE